MRSLDEFLDFILIKIPIRLFKKNVILGLGGGRRECVKRAFIYFKTDPFFSTRLCKSFAHTNNAEIVDIVKVFNRLGFVVDLVDRDAGWHEIEALLVNQYDIYLANAAGNSSPLHLEINARINADFRILFAAGPEPDAANRLVEARHNEFDRRSGKISRRRRLIEGGELTRRFERMDAIFFVGNRFSQETYARHCLPAFRIYPSTSPKVHFDAVDLDIKRSTNFMYFGGNGLICKGLDLVLEAFDGLKGVKLDICGPDGEIDFWMHYKPLLARNPHIRFHGFVHVGSEKFSAITEAAAFQVFPGSSEGCATSVVTCMRRGVIPVTTYETGVDMGEFGILIDDVDVESIRALIIQLKDIDAVDMRRRVVDTYLASMEYTPERFVHSFETALLKTCFEGMDK